MPCTNTHRTMVERHHGWESASRGLLARVFNMSVQQATAICALRCAACGKAICGCSDAAWSGAQHSNTPLSSFADDRDGIGSFARAASQGVNAGTDRGPLKPAKSEPVATFSVSA